MASVLIVVLNWNGIKDTKRCLDSLLGQTYHHYKILVVDNASSDNSLKQLQKIEATEPKITVIANQKNKGFAGGVNTGIHYAIENDFDAVALFNNDAIADKNWLNELVKALKKPNTSIVTGLLLHSNGKTIDSTGDYYTEWGMPYPRGRDLKISEVPESGYVFGGSGGATLYKTSLFKEIGLFDESFFMYYEDVDLSFRAQLAGHRVYSTNTAIAYHKQSASTKKVPGLAVYNTFKNLPLLYMKNVPTGLLFPIGIRLLLLYILIFGNAVKNGSGKYAFNGWLASIWHFWTKAIWRRIWIQSRRKVDTAYINSILWHDIPPNQTGMRRFRQFFTGSH